MTLVAWSAGRIIRVFPPRVASAFIPASQAQSEAHANKRHQREPGEAALSPRQNDERRQQRAERVADIAADLEKRLCESVSTARGQPGKTRRFRMEDRAAKPEQRPTGEQHGEAGREGQRDYDQAACIPCLSGSEYG